ncbi:LysR family transcriptional regulator, partial [Burkholderia pseudomallei]
WSRDRYAVLPIRASLPGASVHVVTRRDSPLTPAAAMLVDWMRDAARRQGLR